VNFSPVHLRRDRNSLL